MFNVIDEIKIGRSVSLILLGIVMMAGCYAVYTGQLTLWSEQEQVYVNATGKVVVNVEKTDGKYAGVLELYIVESVVGASLTQEKYTFEITESPCVKESCGHYISSSGEHIPVAQEQADLTVLIGSAKEDTAVTVTAVGRSTMRGSLEYRHSTVYFSKNGVVVGVFKGTTTADHSRHPM